MSKHMPSDGADLPFRPCVGIMLAREDGKIFVGERIDNPGAWQMPQGGIDPGETPITAALRELREETGVRPEHTALIAESKEWLRYDLPPALLGKLWGGRFRGQEQKWFLMRFQGRDSDIDIAQDPAEFSAWRWEAMNQLVEHIVPFKKELYREVIAEFRGFL